MKPKDTETCSITPVILAGGTGTRLWPVSRKHFPKQFSDLFGDRSLFQKCAMNLKTSGDLEFENPIIVSGSDFRFVIGEQLLEVGITPGSILIEPTPRNTAAAVLAATMHELKKNANAVLLVAPSDQLISDIPAFHKAIKIGLQQVEKSDLVLFGIPPTTPETGYGYIKLAEHDDLNCRPVDAFVEKPKREIAERMLNEGTYFWNAGIFLFRASDMLNAFKRHRPELISCVDVALKNGNRDLDFYRLETEAWDSCQSISIDHAIMEHVKNLAAVPLTVGWSDLGSWDALKVHSGEIDINGNRTFGNATAVDCQNTLLRAEHKDQQLVGLGHNNINAIAMQDSVLVMDNSKSQDVGRVVELLKENKVPQAESFPWEHRPWGRFEVLVEQTGFKVKRIVVKPGGVLSLQKHERRAEHWVVVEGTARVTLEEEVFCLTSGESIQIPMGAIHRMENRENSPMTLIEVQTGDYLGEDDIIRLDDVYARKS